MTVLCPAVNAALPAVGLAAIPGPLSGHVASCAVCTAEVERYQAMHDDLASLDPAYYRTPHGLVAAVMGGLGPTSVEFTRPKLDARLPVAAAAVVATAACGTAVLIKLYRDRAA